MCVQGSGVVCVAAQTMPSNTQHSKASGHRGARLVVPVRLPALWIRELGPVSRHKQRQLLVYAWQAGGTWQAELARAQQ